MRGAVCVLMAMLSAGLLAQSARDARFEVASVIPISREAAAGRSYRAPPGSFTSAMSVTDLIPLAYQLDSYRVVGFRLHPARCLALIGQSACTSRALPLSM
jgi:hypothetical protein